ncbi:MAG: hypothetical protein HETSPECPRED_008296 [Heterodermia speciosa]|uniref:Uncharacterized protein n=1 Tax=Heterodermia speciosa TaxID=116794 RepID=A0A8H3FTY3_9LECA|nr:MAG: hypothetical protein HETSPECPRED_008296 [Heterodermia speciosa]
MEAESSRREWETILRVQRMFKEVKRPQKDPVLIALERRKDIEFKNRSTKGSFELHQAYRASLLRFYDTTARLPNHGGIPPTDLPNLLKIFDGSHDHKDNIQAWWQRRNALIHIQRARHRAGVPLETDSWEGWPLPSRTDVMLEELCLAEAEEAGAVDEVVYYEGGERRVRAWIGVAEPLTEEEQEKIKGRWEMHMHEIDPVPDNLDLEYENKYED